MNLSTHERRRKNARSLGISVLAMVSFPGLMAFASRGSQGATSQQAQPSQKETFESLDTIVQSHATYRQGLLAELRKVASKRGLQIDDKSLTILSHNEANVLAGVAVSRTPPLNPQDQLKEDLIGDPAQEKKPADGGRGGITVPNPREPLGFVAVVGPFLSVHSRPIDAGARPAGQPGDVLETTPGGAIKLEPGCYIVRRGQRENALELVSLDDRVALTFPFRPGGSPAREEMGGDKKPKIDVLETDGKKPAATDEGHGAAADRSQQRPRDRRDDLGDSTSWPTIFIELVHAIDLTGGR